MLDWTRTGWAPILAFAARASESTPEDRARRVGRMRRVVPVLIGVAALLVAWTPAAGARPSPGAPAGFEKLVFIDYGVRASAQPAADAMANDFHLLGGHPSWPALSTVHYSVNTTGCATDCGNATT